MIFDQPFWRQTLKDRDIRLAFFDVDGTVLNAAGNFSNRLQVAIQQLRQQGVKTAIASGRAPYAAQFVIDGLGLRDAGLFYTGALLYDPATARVLDSQYLSKRAASAVIQLANSMGVYVEVCTAEHFYINPWSFDDPISKVHRQHLRSQPHMADLDVIVSQQPVLKLLLAADEIIQPGILQRIQRCFPELIFAYACLPSQPSWSFVSVISADANKDTAFDKLLSIHQVHAQQVVAFGDADSDKVFLRRAGLGVAMGTAHEDVKSAADAVTVSVEDDGVARVLEIWLEER